jgi:triosephosphate isomerase
MNIIFINLKRFDVAKKYGGLCPKDDPIEWIEEVIDQSIASDLGNLTSKKLVFLLPEGLIPSAIGKINQYTKDKTTSLSIGSQGVHWEDISPGKNFGAYTTLLPASAAKNLGCKWTIIGHSEERKAKFQIINHFEPAVDQDEKLRLQAIQAVNKLINKEVLLASNLGLNILLCVGESAEERGDGDFAESIPKIKKAIGKQLLSNLEGFNTIPGQELVIGYEPIWAIGPGKTPPGKEYIAFVSGFIKEFVNENFGYSPAIVYGGGLKEENAAMIASINTIDGGLVALTKFTNEIGFYVEDLAIILKKFRVEARR